MLTSPLKDKYQLLKEEHRQILDELTQARATIETYEREYRRKNEELRQASRNNSYLQNKLDAKILFDFSTDTDTISISEVSKKVTALNEEIFQAAAVLGEDITHKRRELSKTRLDAAAAVSREMVGEKMTNLLITQSQKPEPEVNPLLVQAVLQIFMVNFCVSKSWYPCNPAIGGSLAAIYSEIRSTEEQEVSSRWRALTLAKTRPSTKTWKNELYQKLQSVLMIASWTSESLSSDYEDSYGKYLPSIFRAIYELRIAIGENFTSADLEIFAPECDTIYNPASMDDAYAYGDDRQQSSGKEALEAIVGTAGIGLAKVTSIAKGSGKDFRLQIIIPAKIVFWSTLKEALEPIQSTMF